MGAKITFDPANREFVCVGPPVDGVIEIDLQVDLYSDAKEDWANYATYPDLSSTMFPILAIGGNAFGDLTLGVSYLILHGWHFRPYEADHTLRLVGNIGTAEGWELVHDTVGSYRVRVENQVSALVELRTTGVSGLTTEESQALLDIDANIDGLVTDVAALTALIGLLKDANDLTNEQAEAEHITSRTLGKVILRNTDVMRRWEAPAYEDEGKSIAYGTTLNAGIEAVGMLVEVAWS